MNDPAVPAAPPAAPPAPIMQAVQDASTALPSLATQLASLYATREPLRQSLDILDAEIKRVETIAHQTMATQGASTFVSVGNGTLSLKPKTAYIPESWDAIYDHISTTREFDLLHKRLSITALNERGPALPPGVVRTQFDEFKFTPSKK